MMSKPMLARNPEFETVVRESFSRQAMMTTLGASLTLVEPGRVHIAFPKSDRFTQQNGFVHAGAIASVADSACGYAAFTLTPTATDVLAVDLRSTFSRQRERLRSRRGHGWFGREGLFRPVSPKSSVSKMAMKSW